MHALSLQRWYNDTTRNIYYFCKLEITKLVLFVHSCYCIIRGEETNGNRYLKRYTKKLGPGWLKQQTARTDSMAVNDEVGQI